MHSGSVVIDNTVTHVAVEIAQLALGPINRDAERRDPLRLCLAQRPARVLFSRQRGMPALHPNLRKSAPSRRPFS